MPRWPWSNDLHAGCAIENGGEAHFLSHACDAAPFGPWRRAGSRPAAERFASGSAPVRNFATGQLKIARLWQGFIKYVFALLKKGT